MPLCEQQAQVAVAHRRTAAVMARLRATMRDEHSFLVQVPSLEAIYRPTWSEPLNRAAYQGPGVRRENYAPVSLSLTLTSVELAQPVAGGRLAPTFQRRCTSAPRRMVVCT